MVLAPEDRVKLEGVAVSQFTVNVILKFVVAAPGLATENRKLDGVEVKGPAGGPAKYGP